MYAQKLVLVLLWRPPTSGPSGAAQASSWLKAYIYQRLCTDTICSGPSRSPVLEDGRAYQALRTCVPLFCGRLGGRQDCTRGSRGSSTAILDFIPRVSKWEKVLDRLSDDEWKHLINKAYEYSKKATPDELPDQYHSQLRRR